MKILKNLAVCLAVLALSAVTVKSNEPGKTAGKAVVRSVKGSATYEINGMQKPLKANVELPAGASITTGPNSEVYMSVNGITSAVRVGPEATMAIPTMDKIGKGLTAESDTMLDLRQGVILGQVKKISANSKYEIKTPRGVAGIRGTDFRIAVTLLPGGGYSVTFSSITGTVFVSATVSSTGAIETVTLHDGQEYTPGTTPGAAVVAISTVILSQYYADIQVLVDTAFGGPSNTAIGTFPIRPVFPGGGAPPTTTLPGLPPTPTGGG